MKFLLKVRNRNTDAEWEEEYDNPDLTSEIDIDDWCKKTIQYFNNTLRPHESAREYLGFSIVGISTKLKDHNWDKDILRMSADFRGSVIDGMICRNCGVTGKRFGVKSTVKIDSKFNRKVFLTCTDDTKKAVLELRDK